MRGKDLNLRPLGYEPNELPDCSTPHSYGIAPVTIGQDFVTTFSRPASRYANSVLGVDLKVARAVWTIFLFALVVATAYAIRETLVVFMIALFFAYMLTPFVEFVARRIPSRFSKLLALAIVYLALLGLSIAAIVIIGGRLSEEASSLANRLPDFFQNPDWMRKVPLPVWLEPMRDRLITMIQTEFRDGGKNLVPYLSSAGTKLVSGLSVMFFVVLVPILAFFFLKDRPELREAMLSNVLGAEQQSFAEDVLSDVHVLLGQYIRALVLLSLSTFTWYSIFLSTTGAPYFLLLSGVAAALECLPVVGPMGAGITIILATGFSGYTHVPWFIIFWLCFRLFQDYVVSPYLMSAGVELHPLLVLFGVLAGEQIAGVPGMFFSVTRYCYPASDLHTRAEGQAPARTRPHSSQMKLAVLFILPSLASAHMISMSTGEAKVEGNIVGAELRMPAYEATHAQDPEKALLSHIHFRSSGVEGRLTEHSCTTKGEMFICKARYQFPGAVNASK